MGAPEVAAEVGEGAHVVLVAVREEHGAQLFGVGVEVGVVGNDEVDAEHLLVGEHEPDVDDDDVVAVLEQHHVAPDLTEAAERDDA